MEQKDFVTYPIEEAQTQPVISIGGREYQVVPMMMNGAMSQERIDFDDKHGVDGMGKELERMAQRFLHDIATHLYHTAAFTAVDEPDGEDPRVHYVDMFLPILLPVDEKDKWCMEMTDEQIQAIEQAEAERIKTGKPRVAKVVNKED